MFAWSGQWCVSDQEDTTEVAVCPLQKTGWRRLNFNQRAERCRAENVDVGPRTEPCGTLKKTSHWSSVLAINGHSLSLPVK